MVTITIKGDNGLRCLLIWVLTLMTSCVSIHALADEWLTLKESNFRVAEGSALDLSQVFSANTPVRDISIGPSGNFVVSNDANKTHRFHCAPYVFSAPHGFFPSKKEIDELVLQLFRGGYNLIRFHFVDVALMKDAKADFDFNPEQLDRFHYFLAKTKEYNMAWMIDAATSWNGADISVGKNRFARDNNFNLLVHFDPEVQQHWKRLVKDILGSVNPYTDIKTINDPNLLIITTYNELGINYQTNKTFPAIINEKFKSWTARKGMEFPGVPPKNEISKASDLLMEFFAETEQATSQWMREYLAGLGYTKLTTSYNNGKSRQAFAARDSEPLISVHAYFDPPSDFFRTGSTIQNASSVESLAPYVSYFSITRELGKPFIVDEYDQPYWNKYRREASVLVPAYGAFQGWDAVCRFNNPVLLEVGDHQPSRQQQISPFATGVDPVSRAGEKLAALLFRRGDVAGSSRKVGFRLARDFLYTKGSNRRIFPEYLSMLGFQVPIGNLNVSNKHVIDNGFEIDVTSKLWQVKKRLAIMLKQHFSQLAFNLVPTSNDTIVNITKELTLAPKLGLMTVITERTEVALYKEVSKELHLDKLTIVKASGNAMVSVSSLDKDDIPIANSNRMLLLFITNAKNYNSEFSNHGRVIKDNGSLPVLVKNETVEIKLEHNNAEQLSVYALNQQGDRTQKIEAVSNKNEVTLKLDLQDLTHGPTFYFEIIEESHL